MKQLELRLHQKPTWIWEGEFEVFHAGCERGTLSNGMGVNRSVIEYQGKTYRVPACAHPEYRGWLKLTVTRKQLRGIQALSFKGEMQ